MRTVLLAMSVVVVSATSDGLVQAKEMSGKYPVAMFPFEERDADVAGLGAKVTDLLMASLARYPEILLIERMDVEEILEEQEMNLSGLAAPDHAVKVGRLTGAKLLLVGSVLQSDTHLHLITKIIGTETSRVLVISEKGNVQDDLSELVENLGKKLARTITERGKEILPKDTNRNDQLTALKRAFLNGKTQTVRLDIAERHIGSVEYDATASTTLARICNELGWSVFDTKMNGSPAAGVVITGKGVSEFAARHGNLITAKARIDMTVIDAKSGETIAAGNQVAITVDLTEQLAGQVAMEEAVTKLAVRMLPKLAPRTKNGTIRKR
jgi:TolB-like protein